MVDQHTRTFTIHTHNSAHDVEVRQYTGFEAYSHPCSVIASHELVVACWTDGTPELWIVEDGRGLQELRRMYADIEEVVQHEHIFTSPIQL